MCVTSAFTVNSELLSDSIPVAICSYMTKTCSLRGAVCSMRTCSARAGSGREELALRALSASRSVLLIAWALNTNKTKNSVARESRMVAHRPVILEEEATSIEARVHVTPAREHTLVNRNHAAVSMCVRHGHMVRRAFPAPLLLYSYADRLKTAWTCNNIFRGYDGPTATSC
jgi:hypothetical protein